MVKKLFYLFTKKILIFFKGTSCEDCDRSCVTCKGPGNANCINCAPLKFQTYTKDVKNWANPADILSEMGIPAVNGDTPIYESPHNIIIIGSYLHNDGPHNIAAIIDQPTDNIGTMFGATAKAAQTEIFRRYHAKGMKVLLGLFGEGYAPVSDKEDANVLCRTIALYAKTIGYDGVDLNFEDSAAFFSNGTATI